MFHNPEFGARGEHAARHYATKGVVAGIVSWLHLLPEPAAAHIIQGAQGGFGSGFAHPLTGPDHFLAMFAVGLWSAQMGGRYGRCRSLFRSSWSLAVLPA